MRRLGLFLKTTTLGGLFVLLPVIVTVVLLSKAIVVARLASAKLISLVTGQPHEAVQFPMILALLLLLAISFALGLLLTLPIGAESGRWIEQVILYRVPGYAAVKNIINGLGNTESEEMVRPAIYALSDHADVLVFVMEDHGDGRLTIFIPSSPTAASGGIQIVSAERVRILKVRLHSIIKAINQWGVGTRHLLARHLEANQVREEQSEQALPRGQNG
jgi:uncharacterized membrane protein